MTVLVVSPSSPCINAVMGTLIAWVLVRDDFPGKRVVNALIDLPFALPTIVASIVLLSLYGPNSPIDIHLNATQPGLVVALAFVTLPFVVRSVQPVLIEADREVEEAAASLGASNWTTFRRVVLPTLAPAIISGTGLAFARAIGEYGSVVLIGGNIPRETQVASQYIQQQIEIDRPVNAAAVSVALLAIAFVTLFVAAAVVGRGAAPGGGGAVRTDPPRPAHACAPSPSVYLVVPARRADRAHPVAHLRAGHRRRSSTRSRTPAAISALNLSLLIVAIVVPLNVVFGVVTALALVRGRFRGRGLVQAVVDLPFAVSPIVVGVSLILLWGADGWFGGARATPGFRVIFGLPGMVIATIFVTLPFVVREVEPVLHEIGTEQEQAAATLGASGWQTFWRITLPAIRWGLTYGVVLTVARALGEFGAVIMVSSGFPGVSQTLTLLVHSRYIDDHNTYGAYAAATLLMGLAVADPAAA